jgi:hypothetical protein
MLRALRSLSAAAAHLVLLCLAAAVALPLFAGAQTHSVPSDFSITLERTGCVGYCPGYEVTILADGSVNYDGKYWVHVEGIRTKTVPVANAEKLVRRLREENFFAWEEKKTTCLDFPEVHITVMLNGQQKHVLEGCNEPGKVLSLADVVDKAAGIKYWVGHEGMP